MTQGKPMDKNATFRIPSCDNEGCRYLEHQGYEHGCSLDLLLISTFVSFLEGQHTADTCLVRKQINEYRLYGVLDPKRDN